MSGLLQKGRKEMKKKTYIIKINSSYFTKKNYTQKNLYLTMNSEKSIQPNYTYI